ncbi:MAG: alpha/beta fold hydrolase [Rhodospirillales bacterium]
MKLATSETFTHPNFELTSGAALPELTLAYETWGNLNEDGSNAILMCHGYTNHPHAGGDEDGWAHHLVGPGKAIDTDTYFVVCSNMIGSAFGSSGPASINPETGKPYGPDFPAYTTIDMIRAQHLLIDHLGCGQLKAVIGYSYGGHLTFLWGANYPDRMRALVPIAGVIKRETKEADTNRIRAQFTDCTGWNDGHYYDQVDAPGGVREKMIEIRIGTLTRYGLGDYLKHNGETPEAIERIVRANAEKWAHQFDANSLYKLYEAGIGSEADATKIKAPLLDVLANSDSVVDVKLGPPTVERLKSLGVDASFHEIDTPYGHTGPMLDAHKWKDVLRAFLEHIP